MKDPSSFGPKGRTGGKDLLKGQDLKYIYSRLWSYLSRHKMSLLFAVLLTFLSSILGITGTSLAGNAIGAVTGESEKSVFYYLFLMVILYTASATVSYVHSIVMLKISQKMAAKMRADVYDKLITLPVSFFDNKQTGEIVSTISYDINTINESLSGDFVQIISSFVTVVYSFILMLFVSPTLIFVFVLTIPISIIFTNTIGNVVRPLFRKRSATLGEMNGYVEEMISGHKTIKAYGVEDYIIEAFDKKNNEASAAYIKAEANGTMTGPTVNLINNLSLSLVNIVGAILFMNGTGINITGLSKFVLLSRKFSGPINQIANIYSDIQSALAASERVFRLIDEKAEPFDLPGVKMLDDVSGEVKLSNVSFGYTEDERVIEKLSLKVPSGTVVAIVGATGAGKTTIINLLMRFYDIKSGRIEIDNQDIYSVTRDSLRRAYTMVLQDTWFFHGTIFENVAYGKEDVTMEEVIEVCKAAKIHNYIMSLPNEYNTILSESAMNISKGQKQLLTIARAMLIDSNILILDEATSNVDSKTEKDISEAMVRLMMDRTCFVIAHRLSTVRDADLILVLDKGNVVEQGTHNELISRGGVYSDIYRSQFEISI